MAKYIANQAGLSRLSPLKSDVLGTVRDGRLDLMRGSQRHSNLNQLKVGHQAQVHSDQMVFVMARRKAGPHERWPQKLKGELENTPGSLGT